jgi:hypothetical protein
VGLNSIFDNRKAKAGTTGSPLSACTTLVNTIKPFENTVQMLFGNSGAIIGNFKLNAILSSDTGNPQSICS